MHYAISIIKHTGRAPDNKLKTPPNQTVIVEGHRKTGADYTPASRSNILELLDNVEAADKNSSTSISTDDDQSTPTSELSKIAEYLPKG